MTKTLSRVEVCETAGGCTVKISLDTKDDEGSDNMSLYKGTADLYEPGQEISFAIPRRSLQDPDRSGFPADCAGCDLTKFNYSLYHSSVVNLRKIAEGYLNRFDSLSGYGLYLHSSEPGSGKTFFSCCLAASLRAKYKISVFFVRAVDYFEMRLSKNRYDGQGNDLTAKYFTSGIVILDDLGAGKLGDWQDGELFRLIDYRQTNGLTTIVTSNYSQSELIGDAGRGIHPRTVDRINSACLDYSFPAESIRKMKGKARQAEIRKQFGL